MSSAGEGPQYLYSCGRLKLDTGTRVIVYANVTLATPAPLHKFITIVNPLRVGRQIKFSVCIYTEGVHTP